MHEESADGPQPDRDGTNRRPIEVDAAELLRRWQVEDDPGALDALLRIEVEFLKARIRHERPNFLTASASASDVAQSAVLSLLQQGKTPQFHSPSALRAYLWCSAWNLLVDRMRRSNRRLTLPPDSPELEALGTTTGGLATIDAQDQRAALLLVLNLMSHSEREILEPVYFKGLSIEEAAHTLSIHSGAARMRKVRAKLRLAGKLRSWRELIE